MHPGLNSKLHIWQGELWQVQTDAIVNSCLSHSHQSDQIFAHAGPDFAQQSAQLGCILTGEAKLSSAGLLPAKSVIHTVGPCFSVKYKTAAENSLHMAYWHCLETLLEHGHSTIAFDCLHSEARGYPREAGVHIAMRTVRRFLEKFGIESINSVAFVLSSEADLDLYLSICPLYFPRDKLEEQWACANLPQEVGNTFGESVLPERENPILASELSVPIEERQQSTNAQTIEYAIHQTEYNAEDFAAFANMTVQVDSADARVRAMHIEQNCAQIAEETTYMFYLNQAVNTDLSDIQSRNLVYKSGVDVQGRVVVTIITPTDQVDWNRLLLYLIFVMVSCAC